MKELRLQIADELHKQLKQRALDEGVTLKHLTTKALEEYIRRREGQKEDIEGASREQEVGRSS